MNCKKCLIFRLEICQIRSMMIINLNKSLRSICYLAIIPLLFACNEEDERAGVTWRNIEKQLQMDLITAQTGDTIQLDSGYFWFTKGIQLEGKENIVISGAGMDKTFLSFKGQEEGAEGLKVANCRDIQLINFTIEDAKGDNIKVTDTDGIYIRSVKTYWTGGAKETNGAYGLYPVLCKNVLIEDCVAARASDAGIYVGQSDSVIIRGNTAHENVAGIESENSNFVDIYDNHTYNNTGGILVFDLPGLTQYGHHTRIYNNRVISNNHRNFAPTGNIVGVVPPGTGIMLLATRDVEIFDNEIWHNRTSGTAIASYELVLDMEEDAPDSNQEASIGNHNNNYSLDTLYNPFTENIYIHDNVYKNKHWFPTMKSDFGKLLLFKRPFNTPSILFDGYVNEISDQGLRLCIDQEVDISFLNINAPEGLKNMIKTADPYRCAGESLSATRVREPGFIQEEIAKPQVEI